jgi:hypothetical protein
LAIAVSAEISIADDDDDDDDDDKAIDVDLFLAAGCTSYWVVSCLTDCSPSAAPRLGSFKFCPTL